MHLSLISDSGIDCFGKMCMSQYENVSWHQKLFPFQNNLVICYSAQATMAEYHRRGGLNKWNLFLAVLDQVPAWPALVRVLIPFCRQRELSWRLSYKDRPPVVSGPFLRLHLTWIPFFTGPVSVCSNIGLQYRNFFGGWQWRGRGVTDTIRYIASSFRWEDSKNLEFGYLSQGKKCE